METPGYNMPLSTIFALVILSLAILAGGMVLRGRGRLRSRGAVLGWVVLIVLPLFGAGALFRGAHVVEKATGSEIDRMSPRSGT